MRFLHEAFSLQKSQPLYSRDQPPGMAPQWHLSKDMIRTRLCQALRDPVVHV